MSRLIKKIWHDPVMSKIVASVLLLVIGVVWTIFAGWWSAIHSALSKAWVWLFLITPTVNWLLVLLSLAAAVLTVLLLQFLYYRFFDKKGNAFDYRTDEFFNVKWRWDWAHGRLSNLTAYCPACDFEVFFDNSAYDIAKTSAIFCEDCNSLLHQFEQSVDEVESRVSRMILRNVRKRMAESSS